MRRSRHTISALGVLAVLLAVGLAGATCASAQSDPTTAAFDAGLAGTEYYITFPETDATAYHRFMGLMITSSESTVAVVEIPGQSPQSRTIEPGVTTVVEVSRSMQIPYFEEVMQLGIRVTSRAPITVTVVDARYQTSATYTALPTSSWGTSYTPLTLPNGADAEYVSQLTILASRDNTVVTIRPNADTYASRAGQERKWFLDAGEVIQVQAYPGNEGVADMSGSLIEANNPIGVLAGHVRAAVPHDGPFVPSPGENYAVGFEVPMRPNAAWSTEYVSTPMRAGGDRFRAIADANSTHLTATTAAGATQEFVLNKGQVIDVTSIDGAPIATPVHWTSTAPVAIMQLRTSGSYGDPSSAPAMLLLTAVDSMASRSTFAVPDNVNFGSFHSRLRLVAVGSPDVAPDDPANPLRRLTLDGVPIVDLAPELLQQRVGDTRYYAATLDIAGGAHTIVSDPDHPFSGVISGDNGSPSRDEFAMTLPTWTTTIEADVRAPYVAQKLDASKGTVQVMLSDRTDGYFSGLSSVQISSDSPGWQLVSFQPPAPDDDALAVFRAVSDPSGPLSVEVTDRDGNSATLSLSNSICFKTATPDVSSLTIDANQGTGEFVREVTLSANECGEIGHITSIEYAAGGTANPYLYAAEVVDGSSVPVTILPGESTTLRVRAHNGIPAGEYTTQLRIQADDSTVVIPIRLVVGVSSVATSTESTNRLEVYPNPTSGPTTVRLASELHTGARLEVIDALGRVVRHIDGGLAGRRDVRLDGRTDDGVALPSGAYLVRINDGSATSQTRMSVVR